MFGLLGTYASDLTDLGLFFVVLSAITGLSARVFIGKKRPLIHMLLNILGVVLLYIFLVFYILNYVTNGVKTFGGSDLIKPFYYIFLLIHMIGAASMGFLCTFLVIKSVKRFDNSQETEWKKFLFEKEYRTFHKKFGKYSFLLWMFTAISGVMVYIMLYVLSEPAHVIG